MSSPRSLRVSNFMFLEGRLSENSVRPVIEDCLKNRSLDEMEDVHGQRWTIGGMVGRAWLLRNSGRSGWAEAMLELKDRPGMWADSESLSWLMAATYQPIGDPLDPISDSTAQWREVLAGAWKALPEDQRLACGTQAMALLTEQWGQLGQSQNPDKARQRWLMHALEWSSGNATLPLSEHPHWPGWVASRLGEILATGKHKGVRAEEIDALMGLHSHIHGASQEWVYAWAGLSQDLLELYDHHKTTETRGADHIPGLWIGAAAVYFDLAGTWARLNALDLGQVYRQAERHAQAVIADLEPGTVPFTERNTLKVAFCGLQDRLAARAAYQRMGERLPGVAHASTRSPRF